MESSMKTRTSASLTKRFNVEHAQRDLFWPIGSKFLTNKCCHANLWLEIDTPTGSKDKRKTWDFQNTKFLELRVFRWIAILFWASKKILYAILMGVATFCWGDKGEGGGVGGTLFSAGHHFFLTDGLILQDELIFQQTRYYSYTHHKICWKADCTESCCHCPLHSYFLSQTLSCFQCLLGACFPGRPVAFPLHDLPSPSWGRKSQGIQLSHCLELAETFLWIDKYIV